jgi:hypothetical protein
MRLGMLYSNKGGDRNMSSSSSSSFSSSGFTLRTSDELDNKGYLGAAGTYDLEKAKTSFRRALAIREAKSGKNDKQAKGTHSSLYFPES